ncbi:neutral zinc metallopeptidase [Pseudonocardia sp.]|uniref:neutral zinc metallopeptidase n=1 Tax=Pseudonocardia sp. TaxID=60912 RepID=UPI00260CAD03|nr:neutral zinc metallopeptidase [Pseudonocardia sp.]
MRAAFQVVTAWVLTAWVLTGCGSGGGPPAPVAPPAPAVPCLDVGAEAAYVECLQRANDAVWQTRFAGAGRSYVSPRLTVPDQAPRSDRTRDRAFFNARTGVHFPTTYLDDVRAAHGEHARIVLSFTVAHETGHHVQWLVRPRLRAPTRDIELQADCYAGMWARSQVAVGDLDPAVFREGAVAELRRLSADPEEVDSHGAVDERVASLDRGLAAGDPEACDVGTLTWLPAPTPGVVVTG